MNASALRRLAVVNAWLLASCVAPASAELILIDFGQSGNQTNEPSPGVFWNNVVGFNDSIANARNTSGVNTGINVTLPTDASSSLSFTGPNNVGGLSAPSASLLGSNFAVGSATDDYLFFTSGDRTPRLTLGGLDSNNQYSFRFFATRSIASTRVTTYTVTGGDGALPSVMLTTSGENIGADGIYDGNDDMIASVLGVTPDGSNEITIDLAATGGFGYLGIMEISIAAIPEPTAALPLLGMSGLFALRRRR